MSSTGRVILFRHADHGAKAGSLENALPPDEVRRMIETGAKMRRAGLMPTAVVSSPEGRCLHTALALMWGTTDVRPVRTHTQLGELRPNESGEQAVGFLFTTALTHRGGLVLAVTHLDRVRAILRWHLRGTAEPIPELERGRGLILTYEFDAPGQPPLIDRLDDSEP